MNVVVYIMLLFVNSCGECCCLYNAVVLNGCGEGCCLWNAVVCRKLWVEEEKERIQQLQELGEVSRSSPNTLIQQHWFMQGLLQNVALS